MRLPSAPLQGIALCLGAALALALPLLTIGCGDTPPKPYGTEHSLELPGMQIEVWGVAPAINLSGHHEVDAILQADLVYQQLQQVRGLTVVPVDRIVQVFAALGIEQIQSPEQAAQVCQALNLDAVVVPTVTAYDPYAPPKMGASLALFRKSGRQLDFRQAVGMFDSASGTVRQSLFKFAAGRNDPNGPMAEREYFLSMDRYTGFVYHQLIADLIGVPAEPLVEAHE